MKLVNATKLDNDLQEIANSLKEINGITGTLAFPNDFITEINKTIFLEDFICNPENLPSIINLKPTTTAINNVLCNMPFTEIHGPNVTEINGKYGFLNCQNLVTVDLPKLSILKSHNFAYCSSLTDAYFPKAIVTENYGFYSCSNLRNICLSGLSSKLYLGLNSSSVIGVEFLDSFDIIGSATFQGFINMNILILRSTTLIPLQSIEAFGDSVNTDYRATQFYSSKAGGILYVPENLISEYLSATNWSTLLTQSNNQILPIEGSIYETQHLNGTLIGG